MVVTGYKFNKINNKYMFTITKTQQEIVKDELLQINRASEIALSILEENSKKAYNRFWNNPNATPQELCDVMGNNAYQLFTASAEVQGFIKKMKPEHEMLSIPENKEVTFNADGTVTITDKMAVGELLVEEIEE